MNKQYNETVNKNENKIDKNEFVYKLDNTCSYDELKIKRLYIGIVDAIVENLGAFIKINGSIKGLMHEKNIYSMPKKGEEVVVYLKDIKKQGKDTKLDLVQKNIVNFELKNVEKNIPLFNISQINTNLDGQLVKFNGEILQIKQTGGPTIFTISDATSSIQCAGFVSAGKRSYVNIEIGMIVATIGTVNIRDLSIQIELINMTEIIGQQAIEIKDKIENAIDLRSEPSEIDFLIESPILDKLKPSIIKAAKEIRRAIFKSRPIILRHHADADGITAGIAIEKSILPLIEEINGFDSPHFYRRSPSKAPFYELTDVIKDVSFAVEDNIKYGEPYPLIIIVDNGSTEEDLPAYLHTKIYGIDVIVIDHHHPDDCVDKYLLAHVNPYKVGGDFSLTAGMLCTEVARMINNKITEQIKHLPSVAGIGDRSEAKELQKYIDLIKHKYTIQDLKNIALALDYEQYWLRFGSGIGIIDDILDLRSHNDHANLVSMLCEQANSMIQEQMKICIPNVKTIKLKNNIILNKIDVEKFAHKFTFPAPGKTAGEIHDYMCNKYKNESVITLGIGPDFAVIRSKKVLMNIPQIIRSLREEFISFGISGGGHLVVGSIKFVEGAKELVIKTLIEKLENLELEN